MAEVSIIGIDLAKRSFQVHGARADGSVAYRRKLSRGKLLGFLASQPSCTVAMEACASAHYWGREIMALGHEVRLVPPIYVKPFVKRHKNDAADAEAITEAAQRPTMHFVAVKPEAQQAQAMLFHTRDLLVRQRTQTINALRGHLAEYGVVAPQGSARIGQLAGVLGDEDCGLPEAVVELGRLAARADRRARREDRRTRREDPDERTGARRDGAADDDPGHRAGHRDGHRGLRTADGELPVRARLFGLAGPRAPAAHGTGGKPRLGRISKMGQKDLRRLLFTGAMAVVRHAIRGGENTDPWLAGMLARKPKKVVAVALANRTARRVWVLATRKEAYRVRAAA